MNTLVIDAGNTRFKLAIFKKNEIVWQDAMTVLTITGLEKVIAEWNPEATLISSVIHMEAALVDFIRLLPNNIFLNEKTAVPITNKYETPQTLGRDRLANVVAASSIYPHADLLVIDAGTCLKFDIIDKDKNYYGGAISPGLKMRFESLHHFTEMLPLLTHVESAPLTGVSTETSIQSGVQNGMLAEINGICDEYRKHYANLELILTGGDWRYFLNHLKKPIFADPELTLKGLHLILLHNYRP